MQQEKGAINIAYSEKLWRNCNIYSKIIADAMIL